jgi:hypothetical protein
MPRTGADCSCPASKAGWHSIALHCKGTLRWAAPARQDTGFLLRAACLRTMTWDGMLIREMFARPRSMRERYERGYAAARGAVRQDREPV